MRWTRALPYTITAVLLLSLLTVGRSINVAADTANVPSLIISQLKITSSNGQFITVYNSTNTTVDMSKYQLEYFNSYDLSKATASRLIALSGTVPPHGYFMVNDSSLLLCYQLTVDSVSLGLSSTAGLVELLAFSQANPGAPAAPVLQDYVSWSKTAANGPQTLSSNTNAFLQRLPADSSGNPVVNVPGEGAWQVVQPDASNACNLITTTITPSLVHTGLSQLLPSSEPPASIVSLSGEPAEPATVPGIPASDIGLMAPQIVELLPNPNGAGNDSTDEYIELYNPNDSSFDLSGFGLQSGLKTLRKYTFPAGTSLPAHSFVAFYSEATSLGLSNTGSQVKLLDPMGNSISATEIYANAKDNQAWALANGKWYWTTSPTPNSANVVKQPVSTKKVKAASAKSGKTGASKSKAAKPPGAAAKSAGASPDKPGFTPIHPGVLALIAGLALLYGAYEYRADLANRVYQFRRYLEARRESRA